MPETARVALITGGAGAGIGHGISLELAEAGWSLLLVDRDEDSLGTLLRQIEDSRGKAAGLAMDVTEGDAAPRAVRTAVERFGRLDGLVNNAGVGLSRRVEQTRDDGLGDLVISEALQAGLAAQPPAGTPLRFLPTLTIGASDHHTAFGGTLSLAPVQYAGLLVQGMRSLLGQGHRRILLLNSHGGNHAPMQSALAEVALECARSRAFCGGLSYWQVCTEEWKKVRPALRTSRLGHACEIETSLMLALKPELVDMVQAEDDPFHPSLDQPVSSALPFDSITTAGVIGFPTQATADKGLQILDIMARRVRTAIEEWLRSEPTWR